MTNRATYTLLFTFVSPVIGDFINEAIFFGWPRVQAEEPFVQGSSHFILVSLLADNEAPPVSKAGAESVNTDSGRPTVKQLFSLVGLVGGLNSNVF